MGTVADADALPDGVGTGTRLVPCVVGDPEGWQLLRKSLVTP
jgi:hypothetical protein